MLKNVAGVCATGAAVAGAASTASLAATVASRSIATTAPALRKVVNQVWNPPQAINAPPEPTSVVDSFSIDADALLAKHQRGAEMTPEEITAVLSKHNMVTWNAGGAVNQLQVSGGEGVYLHGTDGKKYIDFNSQAMCSNIGHTVPEQVMDAIVEQLREIPYVYPCQVNSPIRAKLSAFLADLFPGDLNSFYYTCGGAEANEVAIRMAKVLTGKHKIISRCRAYHGGTFATLSLTGDSRRWFAEPGMAGVVRIMDAHPYTFAWGNTEEEMTARNLAYVEETIKYEGPQSIAAIIMESVVGTNGILVPPKGYLEGIRGLCDKYEILMIVDEVMAGFGRTGKQFGFMHSDPMIVPDIVTMAKGISGSFLPLGAVAARQHISDHFQSNPIGIGSTYSAHNVGLAAAFEVQRFMLENRVVDNAAAMGDVMVEEMEALADKHPCVASARAIGCFGMIDLQANAEGKLFAGLNEPPSPHISAFAAELRANGMYTLAKGSSFFCNPPLTINEAEMREAFAIIDKSLAVIDEVYEG